MGVRHGKGSKREIGQKREAKMGKSDWMFAAVNEIKWVRLVRDRRRIRGIGFLRNKRVHFSGTNEANGLIRRVSVKESAFVIWKLAELELNDQPDVESNAMVV